MGYGTDEEIISLFYDLETLKLSDSLDETELASKVLVHPVMDGEVNVARAFEPLTKATVAQIQGLGHKTVSVVDLKGDDTIDLLYVFLDRRKRRRKF